MNLSTRIGYCWKPVAILFLVFFIGLFPSMAFAEQPSSYDQTTEDQTSKYSSIREKYAVGDIINAEDASYILENGIAPNGSNLTRAYGSGTFDKTGSNYGTTVRFSGELWHSGIADYTFGGNITASVTSGATPKSMTAYVTCDAYGIQPSGALFLAYSGSVSSSVGNSRTLKMNKSKNYSGFTIVYFMNARVDVVTSSGSSFTVMSE